mmetsp:Transcript_10476/g.31280  ORF Transcript_10476/g.31280 Transcript_10476/m.31280 type:complete len:201 (-) Transcript_10476:32-634(-)
MVLKTERRVNSFNVAKRQATRSQANLRRQLAEEAAREELVAKAWAVGANERGARRDAEQEARARDRDDRDAARRAAEAADASYEGPALVNKKMQKKAQSSDDLLGLALMAEAEGKKSRRRKPRTPPPEVVVDDMAGVPRNTNRDAADEGARSVNDAIELLAGLGRSKSCGALASPRKGSKRGGARKAPQKTWASEALVCG